MRIGIGKLTKFNHKLMKFMETDVRQGVSRQSFFISGDAMLGGVVRGFVGVHGLSSCHVGVTQTTAR